ncbi:hypothetical protein [Alteromonas ponticola]|uniref:Uncharacterized protein n=1 Tax=Alteromonas ponticola TaxID=2720613 RepID=A0ABX1R3A0_9ALTE|nr:hypothetical protein [Alteromonas ponticola]NMH60919.1 hypothetical protein [Alteromonas ponticola]
MKVWMLIPLVIFIAIAGYQFGYYHAKIDISDAKKALLSDNTNSDTENVLADNVVHKVAAAEIPAGSQSFLQNEKADGKQFLDDAEPTSVDTNAGDVIARLEQSARETAARKQAHDEFVDNYQDEDLDIEIATHITDFFALHPEGDQVYFHHVRCDTAQCQLVGQFDGKHQGFEKMLEEMKKQDWYTFGGTSSNVNSDDEQTHFILHLTDRKKQP